jgi:starch synthase
VLVAGDEKLCIAYRSKLPGSSVPIVFLGHDPYYDRAQVYGEGSEYPDAIERFTFLSRGALALCEALDWTPDVIHTNDWHAALVPGCVADRAVPPLEGVRTMLTIHNLGYQGSFPAEQASVTGLSDGALRPYLRDGEVNLLRGGILTADLINTVSPTYAAEILEDGAGLEAELRSRKDMLYGVVNGVDVNVWNPATDAHLWENYDADDLGGKAKNKTRLQQELGLNVDATVPVFGVISRLAEQKGFDLIMSGFDRMMALDVQFVLLGTGAEEYETFFREVQDRYPGKAASLITFSEEWAHRIEASADMFLMPSHYEPCGLNQQYSLLYGTVPVVRATGGLKDTVEEYNAGTDSGTGFLFTDCTTDAFLEAVERAVNVFRGDPEAWERVQRRGMQLDLSWDASADAYRGLYDRLLG